MVTSKQFTITASAKITSANEEWRGVMDEGMSAPKVTGGTIQLPQGGTAQSKAAVTGGVFTEGSEAGSLAEENAMKIINSIIVEELQSNGKELIDNPDETINSIEFLLSNIAKSEYQKIAAEYSDNDNEAEATDQVINSLTVKLAVTGIPTMEEINEFVQEVAVSMINEKLGGAFS